MSKRFGLKSVKMSRLQIYCMCSLAANVLESTVGIVKGIKAGHLDPKLIIGVFGLASALTGYYVRERDPVKRPSTKNPFKIISHHFSNFVKNDPARACALAYAPAGIYWFVEAAKAQSAFLLAVASIGGAGTIALTLSKKKFPDKVSRAGDNFVISSGLIVAGGAAAGDITHTVAGTIYTIGSIVAAELKIPEIKDRVNRNILTSSANEFITGLCMGNCTQLANGFLTLARQFKKPANLQLPPVTPQIVPVL